MTERVDSTESEKVAEKTVDREASLPEIPAGVVAHSPETGEAFVKLQASTAYGKFGRLDPEVEGPSPSYVGQDHSAELEAVESFVEEPFESHEDLMAALLDAALESEERAEGESFDGRQVAEFFSRGEVDETASFLLLLLNQNRPVTASLVLAAASAHGWGDHIARAKLVREELAAVGGVAVEAVGSVAQSFETEERLQVTGHRLQPGSESSGPGQEPRAKSSGSASEAREAAP